jgi:hypothetical protein
MIESMTLIKVGKKARTLFNCTPNEESGAVEIHLPLEIKIADFPDPSIYNVEVFGVYGSYNYLDALSRTSGELGKFLYPQIYIDGKLVAAGCFQELHLNREKLNELGRLFSADSSWTIRLEGMLKGLLGAKSKSLKVLIAGNCQVSGPYGLFFTKDISAQEQRTIWQQLIQFIERELDPYSILLVKDLNGKSDHMDASWRRDSFTATQVLPVMQMEIMPEWLSFDDYLAAMGSKYRIRAKAARKKGKELVVQRWSTNEIAEHIDQIMNLYQQVYQRARFRLQKVSEDYFIKLSAMESDKFIFNAWIENDQLVGFSTMILDKKRADAHLIGLNYDTNKSHSLYLNMLYQYVEDAILSKVELLDLGRTAMEIKSTVGAIPIDLSVYLKLKNPLLNGLACMLAGSATTESWIQRHPFRHN